MPGTSALMPRARFMGRRRHEDLARIVASFDVLVHPGAAETFCQVIQEALAGLLSRLKVGQVIPPDLYQAIAELLVFLYDLDARVPE